MRIAPGREVPPGRVAAVERHDLLHGHEVAADLLDHREIFRADEQDLGLSVVHDMRHLGRRQSPVDRDHHRIGLGHAEHQLEEEITALVEMRDAGLRPDAFGDQGVGDLARRAIEGAVRRAAACIDDGGGVGLPAAMDAHDICEACNFDRHPAFPSVLFVSAFKGLIA